MELSAELFVLDNLLMDLLMLRLAAAIGALRLRPVAAVLAAFLGAVYALLSMSALPQLTALVPKLLLCAAASLPLVSAPRDLPRALLSLLAAACLTGGLMMALCLLLGGSLSGGALIGTVPLRVALLGAAAAALLPRPVRAFFSAVRGRSRRVRLRIVFDDRTLELTALADSGNLLTEPLSGKPVVIVSRALMPQTARGRPVPYAALSGGGVLYAVRPRLVQAYCGGWRAVDALVAPGDVPACGVQAIIDSALLPKGRRDEDVATHAFLVPAEVSEPAGEAAKAGSVHPRGGDAARAVHAGGGAAVGAAPQGGGEGGGGRADRAQPAPGGVHRKEV